MAFYKLSCGLLLPERDLKYKLIMDLEDQAGLQPARLQGARDPDHRDLDQIRGRSLERRVRRSPLAEGPDVEVPIFELGYVAPSSEQGLDVPLRPSLGDGPIEPGAYAREAREILLDEPLRVVLRDAELARQGERTLAVDRREVDRLGAGPHLGRNLILLHAENDRRSLPVDVPAPSECLDERRVRGEVREQPQLDLGVVGREQ